MKNLFDVNKVTASFNKLQFVNLHRKKYIIFSDSIEKNDSNLYLERSGMFEFELKFGKPTFPKIFFDEINQKVIHEEDRKNEVKIKETYIYNNSNYSHANILLKENDIKYILPSGTGYLIATKDKKYFSLDLKGKLIDVTSILKNKLPSSNIYANINGFTFIVNDLTLGKLVHDPSNFKYTEKNIKI